MDGGESFEYEAVEGGWLYVLCLEQIEVLDFQNTENWKCVCRWYAGDEETVVSKEFDLIPGVLNIEYVCFLVSREDFGDDNNLVLTLSFANADHIAVALQVPIETSFATEDTFERVTIPLENSAGVFAHAHVSTARQPRVVSMKNMKVPKTFFPHFVEDIIEDPQVWHLYSACYPQQAESYKRHAERSLGLFRPISPLGVIPEVRESPELDDEEDEVGLGQPGQLALGQSGVINQNAQQGSCQGQVDALSVSPQSGASQQSLKRLAESIRAIEMGNDSSPDFDEIGVRDPSAENVAAYTLDDPNQPQENNYSIDCGNAKRQDPIPNGDSKFDSNLGTTPPGRDSLQELLEDVTNGDEDVTASMKLNASNNENTLWEESENLQSVSLSRQGNTRDIRGDSIENSLKLGSSMQLGNSLKLGNSIASASEVVPKQAKSDGMERNSKDISFEATPQGNDESMGFDLGNLKPDCDDSRTDSLIELKAPSKADSDSSKRPVRGVRRNILPSNSSSKASFGRMPSKDYTSTMSSQSSKQSVDAENVAKQDGHHDPGLPPTAPYANVPKDSQGRIRNDSRFEQAGSQIKHVDSSVRHNDSLHNDEVSVRSLRNNNSRTVPGMSDTNSVSETDLDDGASVLFTGIQKDEQIRSAKAAEDLARYTHIKKAKELSGVVSNGSGKGAVLSASSSSSVAENLSGSGKNNRNTLDAAAASGTAIESEAKNSIRHSLPEDQLLARSDNDDDEYESTDEETAQQGQTLKELVSKSDKSSSKGSGTATRGRKQGPTAKTSAKSGLSVIESEAEQLRSADQGSKVSEETRRRTRQRSSPRRSRVAQERAPAKQNSVEELAPKVNKMPERKADTPPLLDKGDFLTGLARVVSNNLDNPPSDALPMSSRKNNTRNNGSPSPGVSPSVVSPRTKSASSGADLADEYMMLKRKSTISPAFRNRARNEPLRDPMANISTASAGSTGKPRSPRKNDLGNSPNTNVGESKKEAYAPGNISSTSAEGQNSTTVDAQEGYSSSSSRNVDSAPTTHSRFHIGEAFSDSRRKLNKTPTTHVTPSRDRNYAFDTKSSSPLNSAGKFSMSSSVKSVPGPRDNDPDRTLLVTPQTDLKMHTQQVDRTILADDEDGEEQATLLFTHRENNNNVNATFFGNDQEMPTPMSVADNHNLTLLSSTNSIFTESGRDRESGRDKDSRPGSAMNSGRLGFRDISKNPNSVGNTLISSFSTVGMPPAGISSNHPVSADPSKSSSASGDGSRSTSVDVNRGTTSHSSNGGGSKPTNSDGGTFSVNGNILAQPQQQYVRAGRIDSDFFMRQEQTRLQEEHRQMKEKMNAEKRKIDAEKDFIRQEKEKLDQMKRDLEKQRDEERKRDAERKQEEENQRQAAAQQAAEQRRQDEMQRRDDLKRELEERREGERQQQILDAQRDEEEKRLRQELQVRDEMERQRKEELQRDAESQQQQMQNQQEDSHPSRVSAHNKSSATLLDGQGLPNRNHSTNADASVQFSQGSAGHSMEIEQQNSKVFGRSDSHGLVQPDRTTMRRTAHGILDIDGPVRENIPRHARHDASLSVDNSVVSFDNNAMNTARRKNSEVSLHTEYSDGEEDPRTLYQAQKTSYVDTSISNTNPRSRANQSSIMGDSASRLRWQGWEDRTPSYALINRQQSPGMVRNTGDKLLQTPRERMEEALLRANSVNRRLSSVEDEEEERNEERRIRHLEGAKRSRSPQKDQHRGTLRTRQRGGRSQLQSLNDNGNAEKHSQYESPEKRGSYYAGSGKKNSRYSMDSPQAGGRRASYSRLSPQSAYYLGNTETLNKSREFGYSPGAILHMKRKEPAPTASTLKLQGVSSAKKSYPSDRSTDRGKGFEGGSKSRSNTVVQHQENVQNNVNARDSSSQSGMPHGLQQNIVSKGQQPHVSQSPSDNPPLTTNYLIRGSPTLTQYMNGESSVSGLSNFQDKISKIAISLEDIISRKGSNKTSSDLVNTEESTQRRYLQGDSLASEPAMKSTRLSLIPILQDFHPQNVEPRKSSGGAGVVDRTGESQHQRQNSDSDLHQPSPSPPNDARRKSGIHQAPRSTNHKDDAHQNGPYQGNQTQNHVININIATQQTQQNYHSEVANRGRADTDRGRAVDPTGTTASVPRSSGPYPKSTPQKTRTRPTADSIGEAVANMRSAMRSTTPQNTSSETINTNMRGETMNNSNPAGESVRHGNSGNGMRNVHVTNGTGSVAHPMTGLSSSSAPHHHSAEKVVRDFPDPVSTRPMVGQSNGGYSASVSQPPTQPYLFENDSQNTPQEPVRDRDRIHQMQFHLQNMKSHLHNAGFGGRSRTPGAVRTNTATGMASMLSQTPGGYKPHVNKQPHSEVPHQQTLHPNQPNPFQMSSSSPSARSNGVESVITHPHYDLSMSNYTERDSSKENHHHRGPSLRPRTPRDPPRVKRGRSQATTPASGRGIHSSIDTYASGAVRSLDLITPMSSAGFVTGYLNHPDAAQNLHWAPNSTFGGSGTTLPTPATAAPTPGGYARQGLGDAHVSTEGSGNTPGLGNGLGADIPARSAAIVNLVNTRTGGPPSQNHGLTTPSVHGTMHGGIPAQPQHPAGIDYGLHSGSACPGIPRLGRPGPG